MPTVCDKPEVFEFLVWKGGEARKSSENEVVPLFHGVYTTFSSYGRQKCNKFQANLTLWYAKMIL